MVYRREYERSFLQRSLQSANYCRSCVGQAGSEMASNAPNGLACHDVVLFWRLLHMLRDTARALRQEALLHRGRLEQDVKEVRWFGTLRASGDGCWRWRRWQRRHG